MNSSALQKPFDPDVTYINKAGKQHRGYVANLEETVGKNGFLVTDYQFDKNIHTDSRFFRKRFHRWKNPSKKSFWLQMAVMTVRITLPLQLR